MSGVLITPQKRELLMRTPLFANAPVEESIRLMSMMKYQRFRKNEYLFQQGDTEHHLLIIDEGHIKITAEKQGDTQLINMYGSGEIIGVLPMFNPKIAVQKINAVSITSRTTAYSLPANLVHSWMMKNPVVMKNMLQLQTARLQQSDERVNDLIFKDVPARLAKTLINLAIRFGTPSEQGLVVPNELTQEELAQLVGATRETINKALMEFTNRGWIHREGRTIIIFQPGNLIRRSNV